MEKISRNEAKSKGMIHYYTGKACKRGHYSPRYVLSHACVACGRLKNNEHRTTSKYEETRRRTYEFNRENKRSRILYNGAKARARRDSVNFDLTQDYIESIWPKDNKCPALGILLEISMSSKGHNAPKENSPSLDRLVPSKGYVRGNVCIISLKANQIKNNATAEEIQKVANWLKEAT